MLGAPEASREDRPDLIPLGSRARRFLEQAAEGDAAAFESADELARDVLSSPLLALARRVLAGGPHVLAHATALADLLLADRRLSKRKDTGT